MEYGTQQIAIIVFAVVIFGGYLLIAFGLLALLGYGMSTDINTKASLYKKDGKQ